MRTLPAVIALLLAGCATAPAPFTAEQIGALETPKLCEEAGVWYVRSNAQQFHLIREELNRRNALNPECVSLAQIGGDAEEKRQRRSYASRAAWAAGMQSMSDSFYQRAQNPTTPVTLPKTGNCTTIQTGTTSQTQCH